MINEFSLFNLAKEVDMFSTYNIFLKMFSGECRKLFNFFYTVKLKWNTTI